MTTQRQRATYLRHAMTAICELMCSYGINKRKAREYVQHSIERGYQRGTSRLSQEAQPLSQMSDVLSRWHFERAYLGEDGKPRPLTWNGSSGSLLTLVTRVNGRQNSRLLVKELISRKLISRNRGGLWLPVERVLKPSGLDAAQSLRAAHMIDGLLRTIAYNSQRGYRGEIQLDLLATVPRLPSRYIRDFKRFTRAQGMGFIRTVDDWLESRNVDRSRRNRGPTREVGVVTYTFHKPSRGAKDQR